MKRKPCPTCSRIRLDASSMHALLNPIDLYARGRITVGKLQDYINEAILGQDDHDTAFGLTERIERHLRLHGPATAAEIADGVEHEAEIVRQILTRLRARRIAMGDGKRPQRWELTARGERT